jgi:hypothetical protein
LGAQIAYAVLLASAAKNVAVQDVGFVPAV